MKMDFKNGKLSAKGSAAVLCFCLAAVAALGIFSYSRSSDELKQELSGISGGTANAASEQAENVPKPSEETAAQNSAAADAPAVVPFEGVEGDVPADADIMGGDEGIQEAAAPIGDNAAAPASGKFSGAVVRPVNGEVLCSYSDGELIKSKTLNVWKTHDGIDVSADIGTPVRSMADGTVSRVCADPLMGITVVIDHGSGFESWYCNLSADLDVECGDDVSAGTVIGQVGDTAEGELSEENHLHFGLKKNGAWTDPSELLSNSGS